MPDIAALRALRTRADTLLKRLKSDLDVFRHEKDRTTFRRKPDSSSRVDDVNVTTTCSCVMALAMGGEFQSLYGLKSAVEARDKALDIMDRLIRAPWMSSGLTSNNAFTTALVFRTYGFLVHKQLLSTSEKFVDKAWELELKSIKSVVGFASKLRRHNNPTTSFLYHSLSDKSRDLLDKLPRGAQIKLSTTAREKLRSSLTADLRQVTQGSAIFESSRFPRTSVALRQRIDAGPLAYVRAEINHQLLSEAFPQDIARPQKQSLTSIAAAMAGNTENFRINNYPVSPAVVYWFIDGVDQARLKLSSTTWRRLCEWASQEFSHQRSLVLASHDAMMDPVMLGMAAALCARLRTVCRDRSIPIPDVLPSEIELRHSIDEVFRSQADSGIWPKYFPMFHYQEAGSNFCFTFELLEAILHEFGDAGKGFLDGTKIFAGLERAVKWCEQNQLVFADTSATYRGWNSGGELEALKEDKPESWATAVVYMFLLELRHVLSEEIQSRILDKYKARRFVTDKGQAIDDLLDIDLFVQQGRRSLKKLLATELLPVHRGKSASDLRSKKMRPPLSALLFGPPGTSKTKVTEAIAKALGWPLVVINPTEFVKGGLDRVFVQAEDIFSDLGDLAGAVVFFDEMDALTQSRAESVLDTETQFVTTSMLPQLTQLHDDGHVVFFMATNFQSRFDAAIKRAGRFDLLLCMGPPTIAAKLNGLASFFDRGELPSAQATKAKSALERFSRKNPWIRTQLELLTYADFGNLLAAIGQPKTIGDELAAMKLEAFEKTLREQSKFATLRLDQLDDFKGKLPEWGKLSASQQDAIRAKKSEIGRYLEDRAESKIQYRPKS